MASEPKMALFADEEGLAIYRQIIEEAYKYLTPSGKLYFEIGYKQGMDLKKLLSLHFPDKRVRVLKDQFGQDRMVVMDDESKKVLREILADGGAVVLPTETVYGLFAKALDESAVNHVYELKNRPRDKAMNLNVASYEDILSYSKEQPKYLKQLYDAFLPGPLTII